MAVVPGGGADRMALDAVGQCAAAVWSLPHRLSLRRRLSSFRGAAGAIAVRGRAAASPAEFSFASPSSALDRDDGEQRTALRRNVSIARASGRWRFRRIDSMTSRDWRPGQGSNPQAFWAAHQPCAAFTCSAIQESSRPGPDAGALQDCDVRVEDGVAIVLLDDQVASSEPGARNSGNVASGTKALMSEKQFDRCRKRKRPSKPLVRKLISTPSRRHDDPGEVGRSSVLLRLRSSQSARIILGHRIERYIHDARVRNRVSNSRCDFR